MVHLFIDGILNSRNTVYLQLFWFYLSVLVTLELDFRYFHFSDQSSFSTLAAHPRPMKTEFLGIGFRYHYLLKLSKHKAYDTVS